MTTLTPDALSTRPRKPFSWGRALAWLGLSIIILISVFPVFIVLKTALTTNKALYSEGGGAVALASDLRQLPAGAGPAHARTGPGGGRLRQFDQLPGGHEEQRRSSPS